jgi:hypothetical protein
MEGDERPVAGCWWESSRASRLHSPAGAERIRCVSYLAPDSLCFLPARFLKLHRETILH